MSSDLTAIDAELNRLIRALRSAVGSFEGATRDAADKRSVYDLEKAKALIKTATSDETMPLRQARATLMVEQFMREARIAEAMREAYKERIRAIEAVISIQQSKLRFLNETEPSGFQ